MNNSPSIKEARLSKGLSIEHLAAKLNISPMIIEKIENDEHLPDRSVQKFNYGGSDSYPAVEKQN